MNAKDLSRNAAKHKGMTRKHALPAIPTSLEPYVSIAPAYHKRGPELVRRLKGALDKVECDAGQAMTQKAFGAILGIPKSTIHDWFEGPLPEPLRAFFCGLERLGWPEWVYLVRGFLRNCPRLNDSRLAHNAGFEKALRQDLSKPTGLIIIRGTPQSAGKFLFAAVGNAVRRIKPKARVCGIDVQAPVAYCAVPGLFYIRQPTDRERTRSIVCELWRLLRETDADVLLLDEVVKAAPELWPQVVKISKERLVIISDNALPIFGKDVRDGRNATLFDASADKSVPGKINVAVVAGAVAGLR